MLDDIRSGGSVSVVCSLMTANEAFVLSVINKLIRMGLFKQHGLHNYRGVSESVS